MVLRLEDAGCMPAFLDPRILAILHLEGTNLGDENGHLLSPGVPNY